MTPPERRRSARHVAARATAIVLALAVPAGRAAAHPGHDGAASEPSTWLAVGPIVLGAVATATAAGLRREGLVSGRAALAGVGLGTLLLVSGLLVRLT